MEIIEIEIDVNESAITSEAAGMDDSRGHSTLNMVKEVSLTELAVADDSIIHSTPIKIKKSDSHDIMNMMQLLLSLIHI